MREFSTTIVIRSSAEYIWNILIAGERWTEWNRTVTRLDGKIARGETVKVWVKANPGRAFPVKVVRFDRPHRMVWSGGMPFGLFKGERTYTLSPRDDGQTEFSMIERFSGPMSSMIEKSIPDLQPTFEEFARCLKQRAEQ